MANFFITVGYIVLAIVILLLMVLIHEFGHYVAGRKLGFKIEEFSIGFGKAIFSKTNKRGEKISLRIFPLGGYCAFKGDEDENSTSKDPEVFINQKPWKRIIVFLAGVAFNFISAIIFSFILLVSVGYDIRQIEAPTTGLNSDKLQAGDVIYAVNGENVDFAFGSTFEDMIRSNGTGYVTLKIKRNIDGVSTIISVANVEVGTVEKDGKTYYDLGFSFVPYRHNFGEALARCIPFAFGLAWVVLKSLWLLITFQIPISQIGGPISTISMMAQVTQQSFLNFFVLLPAIAANLAVFNILPFPALDGSHVVFTTIEWIRGKPINRKIENYIHSAGLMILFAFVIIVDILHFVL